MIVIVVLVAVLGFTVVTSSTSLLLEKAHAGRLRPYITLCSVVALASFVLWVLHGGAARALESLAQGFTVRGGTMVILGGMAAGLLISSV